MTMNYGVVAHVQQAEIDDLKFQVEQLKKAIVEKDMHINKITFAIGELIGFLNPVKEDLAISVIEKLEKLKNL